ncbi:MAG: flagellar biosynthetic protein FliO [Eubacteriales bacterium]
MAKEIQTQDVILLIVYLVLLLVGAYYLTKFVSKRSMQKGSKKRRVSGERSRWKQGQLVSVVDRIPIDRDKTIMVVEFGSKHYLMATSGQDIKLLDTVNIQQSAQADDMAEQETSENLSGQNTQTGTEEESFFKKFLRSFKSVSKNYYKNKNTTPFGIHLRKELDIEEEARDIHPDNGDNDSNIH